MWKKALLTLNLCLLTSFAFAENCPTVADLHNHNFNSWQAFDINSGLPANKKVLDNFLTLVGHFDLAEWMQDAPEGVDHCYYKSGEAGEDYLDVYFVKDNLVPLKHSSSWRYLGKDIAQCKGPLTDCEFEIKKTLT
jgi:hypothetical protein